MQSTSSSHTPQKYSLMAAGVVLWRAYNSPSFTVELIDKLIKAIEIHLAIYAVTSGGQIMTKINPLSVCYTQR